MSSGSGSCIMRRTTTYGDADDHVLLILNGEGFALVANHSLVMASFISRANAAVIDLRMLLERG